VPEWLVAASIGRTDPRPPTPDEVADALADPDRFWHAAEPEGERTVCGLLLGVAGLHRFDDRPWPDQPPVHQALCPVCVREVRP
jgi:hypothetical protein